ncbi:Modulator of DNA gyrase OS=Streptomyces fumanus OX=67302 GN=GCM10018772_64360 PE=3 SV=1 [Streptomyces fumanus]
MRARSVGPDGPGRRRTRARVPAGRVARCGGGGPAPMAMQGRRVRRGGTSPAPFGQPGQLEQRRRAPCAPSRLWVSSGPSSSRARLCPIAEKPGLLKPGMELARPLEPARGRPRPRGRRTFCFTSVTGTRSSGRCACRGRPRPGPASRAAAAPGAGRRRCRPTTPAARSALDADAGSRPPVRGFRENAEPCTGRGDRDAELAEIRKLPAERVLRAPKRDAGPARRRSIGPSSSAADHVRQAHRGARRRADDQRAGLRWPPTPAPPSPPSTGSVSAPLRRGTLVSVTGDLAPPSTAWRPVSRCDDEGDRGAVRRHTGDQDALALSRLPRSTGGSVTRLTGSARSNRDARAPTPAMCAASVRWRGTAPLAARPPPAARTGRSGTWPAAWSAACYVGRAPWSWSVSTKPGATTFQVTAAAVLPAPGRRERAKPARCGPWPTRRTTAWPAGARWRSVRRPGDQHVLGGAFNCGPAAARGRSRLTASHGCPSALFRGVNILNTTQEAGR